MTKNKMRVGRMSETNNNLSTKSKKLDSNGEEIIWELKFKRNPILWIWSWIVRLGLIIFCIYVIDLFLRRPMGLKDFIVVVAMLGIIVWFIISVYKTINLKHIYATKNNLVINRYVGNDTFLPLGTFYITIILGDYSFHSIFAFLTRINIKTFDNDASKCYFEIAYIKDNFNELENIRKSYIESYLLTLKTENLKTIQNIISPSIKRGYTAFIDFDKIDSLREKIK